jgi:hypothetical protein
VQWQHGFFAAHVLRTGAGLTRGALSTKRPQRRLLSVA